MRPFHPLVVAISLLAGCSGESGPCDPSQSSCAYSNDYGVRTVEPGGEISNLCQSWTLHNEQELWVTNVRLENDGAYHHSNWFFVPDNNFELPDGAWSCADNGFEELVAAILGGVLFAQSTQATIEEQQFAPGVAVRIPPHSRIIGSTHLLNVGDGPIDTGLRMTIETLPERDVEVKLTPFRLTYYDLHIPAQSSAEFTATCDIASEHMETMSEPWTAKLHYVLPHYHSLGNLFRISVAGGPDDGELIFELTEGVGEAHGKAIDPPIDLTGATGFTFTCGFMNGRDTEVGWGIGDQEMCVMLGFAETSMAFDASASANTVVGDRDGTVLNESACSVLGIPFDQNK
jgi:hypothetical protein